MWSARLTVRACACSRSSICDAAQQGIAGLFIPELAVRRQAVALRPVARGGQQVADAVAAIVGQGAEDIESQAGLALRCGPDRTAALLRAMARETCARKLAGETRTALVHRLTSSRQSALRAKVRREQARQIVPAATAVARRAAAGEAVKRRARASSVSTRPPASATAGRYRNRSAIIVPMRMAKLAVGARVTNQNPTKKTTAAVRRQRMASATAAAQPRSARSACALAQSSRQEKSGIWL